MTKPRLDLTLADSVGYIPDQLKVNTVWSHFKTPESRYYITGFLWDAETDRWKYTYKDQNSFITCARTPKNFHQKVVMPNTKNEKFDSFKEVSRFIEVEPTPFVTRLRGV